MVFAQLAEEHRRADEYDEAVRIARHGLMHLAYLSVDMTLTRAFTHLQRYEEAKTAFEYALVGPDNVVAICDLADLCQRTGEGAGEEGAEVEEPAAASAAAPDASPFLVVPPPLDDRNLGSRVEPAVDEERLELCLPDREPEGEDQWDQFDTGLLPVPLGLSAVGDLERFLAADPGAAPTSWGRLPARTRRSSRVDSGGSRRASSSACELACAARRNESP